MEKHTESERVFKFDENRQLFAIDYERNVYKGTLEEAIELSQTEMFQLKRGPETEQYFGESDAAFCLFGKGEPLSYAAKQDVTQHLFLLESQHITDMTKYDVLANLRLYCGRIYGSDRYDDDIEEAFGTYSENGSQWNTEILFEKTKNQIVVHLDVEDATRFVLNLDAQKVITSVEIA